MTTLRVITSSGDLIGVGLTPIVIDRESLTPGYFFPDHATTGCTSAVSELNESTVFTFDSSYNGQVIRNLVFSQTVYVTGQGITFENCYFRGPSLFAADKIVILTNSSTRGILFKDCTFRPQYSDYRQHIIQGHDFTLLRCDISGGVDGVNVLGRSDGVANVSILGSWIHDLVFWSPDPTHGDNSTHNDCVQVAGGTGLVIEGSVLDAYYDLTRGNPTAYPRVGVVGNPWPVSPYSGKWRALSCLMLNHDASSMADEILIRRSWFNGGAVGVNALDPNVATTSFRIEDSWFGLDQRLIDDKGLTYTIPNSYAVTVPLRSQLDMVQNHLWVSDPFNRDTAFDTRKVST